MKLSDSLVVDLQEIKKIIISEFVNDLQGDKHSEETYLDNLKIFLERLIDEKEGQIIKDEYKIKAGRQLLCSIGIDILHKAVPLTHYLKIFKKIDISNYNKEARNLFNDAINDGLQYRESDKRTTDNYNIMICPIKDWVHYIQKDVFGLTGTEQSAYIFEKLTDFTNENYLSIASETFDKGNRGLFWLTTEDIFEELLHEENQVHHIVDYLGLSHFDFTDDWFKYFFKVKIGKANFETFKPNATTVDWGNPKVGFISYMQENEGRTFSISGYTNYKSGIKERVFKVLVLEKIEHKETIILPLHKSIKSPITIQSEEIIVEGVKRFNSKSYYD